MLPLPVCDGRMEREEQKPALREEEEQEEGVCGIWLHACVCGER